MNQENQIQDVSPFLYSVIQCIDITHYKTSIP